LTLHTRFSPCLLQGCHLLWLGMRTRSLDGAHCEYMRSSSRHFCVDQANTFSNRFQPHLLIHSPRLTAGFPTPSPSSLIPPFHLRRFLCSCAVSALLLHSLRCFRLSYAYVVTGLVTSGSICQVSLQFRAIFSHVVTRSRPHTSRSRSRLLPTRVFNALARAHGR
jgi:hypothetical protein